MTQKFHETVKDYKPVSHVLKAWFGIEKRIWS